MLKIPESGQFDSQAPGPEAAPDSGAAFDADHAARVAQTNEASVKSVQANWLDGVNTLLYHPDTGFLNQRGAAAMGGYGPAQDTAEKLTQQASDSLSNDIQRGMFGKATAPLIGAIQEQMRQHAQNQSGAFDADAAQARIQAALSLAVNAFNGVQGADNTLHRYSAAIAHNELENSFRNLHGDPADEANSPLWEHYLQFGPDGDNGMASIPVNIVSRLLGSNQPYEARDYLEGVQHDLPEPTRDKLDQYIRSGISQREGSMAALQAQSQETDLARQKSILDDKLRGGQLDEQAHAAAQHKLEADHGQKLAVQQQNDMQTLGEVRNLKNINPYAAVTDIPASAWAYLKSRGLGRSAQDILDSHPASDDPALFNQLHRLSAEDPVKFAQANLLASSGKLSKAHLDYLQVLQDAINQQDPQAIAANKQINAAVQTVRAEMQVSGINLQPEAGSEEEKQLAQAESGLRDRIIAAQQAKTGTPLSNDEVQNLAMGYFADQVLKGGVAGKGVDGKQPQAQMQDGQKETTPGTQDADHPQNQPNSKQTSPGQPNIMPQGAPAAAGTMSDQKNLDKKIETSNFAVGEKKPNGVIAEGGDPGSRVYVVKSKEFGATLDTICAETGVDYDRLKAINHLGYKDGAGWFGNGRKIILPKPMPGDKSDAEHTPVIDINKSTAVLRNNAKGTSAERCSEYVFKAINAGLPSEKQVTGPHYAKDAGPTLEKIGYKKVLTSSDHLDSYTPQKGDVVVLQDYPGQQGKNGKALPAGHIAMFDGEKWISDFKQERAARIWGGEGFEKAKVGMVVYRP